MKRDVMPINDRGHLKCNWMRRGPALWHLLAESLGMGVVCAMFLVLLAAPLRECCYRLMSRMESPAAGMDQNQMIAETTRLEKDIRRMQQTLERLTPDGAYVIVNTADNRIRLMSGHKEIREGICSTGSYILLKETRSKREWIFHTPRGLFHVREKKRSPVWRKPDWAFVEEGKPIPPQGSAERIEAGVLGEYGLMFGDGYMIHGTLYKRSLGMPVTHGCIRVGDQDLRAIYNSVPVGGKIFIY
jgi:L,D-transpeptidase ErfK/SrfK